MVIDVRMPAELNLLGGHIEATHFFNLTRRWLEFQIESLVPDRTTPIVVYCGVNQRSPLAADTLMRIGYREVYNLADGYSKWRQSGHPVRYFDRAPNSPSLRAAPGGDPRRLVGHRRQRTGHL